MNYNNIKAGRFISRPNRFIAHVEIDGNVELCHVKNTGRCKELLLPDVRVYVQDLGASHRKTKYDLISVNKGDRLINIDSQAPNKVFHEWLKHGKLFSPDAVIRPETRYGGSRFDFYVEDGDRKAFIEVKGVTLEENNIAMFPDAPTERGVKHINELCSCMENGYEAYIVFIIQMKGVSSFSPNDETHKAFGDALRMAGKRGVKILALDCNVTETGITAGNYIGIGLNRR